MNYNKPCKLSVNILFIVLGSWSICNWAIEQYQWLTGTYPRIEMETGLNDNLKKLYFSRGQSEIIVADHKIDMVIRKD